MSKEYRDTLNLPETDLSDESWFAQKRARNIGILELY